MVDFFFKHMRKIKIESRQRDHRDLQKDRDIDGGITGDTWDIGGTERATIAARSGRQGGPNCRTVVHVGRVDAQSAKDYAMNIGFELSSRTASCPSRG